MVISLCQSCSPGWGRCPEKGGWGRSTLLFSRPHPPRFPMKKYTIRYDDGVLPAVTRCQRAPRGDGKDPVGPCTATNDE